MTSFYIFIHGLEGPFANMLYHGLRSGLAARYTFVSRKCKESVSENGARPVPEIWQ